MGSEHTQPELADLIWKLEHGEWPEATVIEPRYNLQPGHMLGGQATLGTIWWLASFLLYLKNTEDDADLVALNGGTIFPIGWFWERVAEPNGLYNYFAIALMANFFMYAITSAVEFAAFIIYLNGDPFFAAFWFSTVGYYGSIVGLALPWIMCAVFIQDTMGGKTDFFPGNWVTFNLVVTLIMWIGMSAFHIYWVPDFLAHVAALPARECICNIPNVEPVDDEASEALKAEFKRASEEREALCLIECPPTAGCPLDKGEDQSEAEYAAACAALKENADKSEEATGASSVAEEDFEESDI
jgi:hypothetical protein